MIRWVICLTILSATPAAAAPLGPALASLGTFLAGNTVGAFLLRTALGVLLSTAANFIGRLFADKPERRRPQTSVTTRGGASAMRIILGREATGGHVAAPPYKTGNDVVLVHALCARPGATLRRLVVDDQWVDFDFVNTDPDFGAPATTSGFTGHIWVKHYDGSQTTADAKMVTDFGADPDYPWSNDMVGFGLCYAIVRMRFSSGHPFTSGQPRLLFEVDGIPLYDPRKDDTAGGPGAHRLDDPATWEQTENPKVMAYNVLAGIDLGGGEVWGGGAAQADLDYATWSTAMDACDALIHKAPRYRAGLELDLDREGDTPRDALTRLDRACSGSTISAGGVYYAYAGGPPLAVGTLDDDTSSLRDAGRTVRPSKPFNRRNDGVVVTHPSPADLWEPITTAPFDVADPPQLGSRRREQITLPVPYADQVARIAAELLADAQRELTITTALPPAFISVLPGDVLDTTSGRLGLAADDMEITRVVVDMASGRVEAGLRIVDQADWN